MIREYARQDNRNTYVGDKKLVTISKSLGVVLRRYGMSRKERARMIDGETVEKQRRVTNRRRHLGRRLPLMSGVTHEYSHD